MDSKHKNGTNTHPPKNAKKAISTDDGFRPTQEVSSRQDDVFYSLNMRICGWFMALFIFATLTWVCLWTPIAAHTDIARNKIYPAFETKYFEGKSGARVFTYLGVFYLMAGTVSLLFLATGMRLPKLTPFMVKQFRFPLSGGYWTVSELFAIFIFLCVQIATIVTRTEKRFEPYWFSDWPAEKVWYHVAKTLGKTSALTLMLLVIPVAKSCFWWDLFNFKFERAIKMHRFLAWFLVVVVIVHAITAITSLIIAGQFRACMLPNTHCEQPGGFGNYEALETSRIITYGWVSTIILLPLVITSIPWFRRKKFEWFYYTHFLFIPFSILLHLHYPSMIYYMAPGLAAYALDKVLCWCSSRRATRIISLTIPTPGFVRMNIAIEDGYSFEPGQWVQIKVPAISILQWHPMSICSAPGHPYISLDIKVIGDWTRGLEELALKFDPSQYIHSCVFLDLFHGSSHSQMQGYLNHPAVMMFAGGCGITPMMSALRTMTEDVGSYPKVSKVIVVWCVRKKSVIDLYREDLAKIQSVGALGEREITICVHATLSEEEYDTESVTIDVDSRCSECENSRVPVKTPFMKYLMGYQHKLVLTILSGGGYLLGIFLANVAAYDQDWRLEYKSLLQLLLGVLFACILVTIGMIRSLFRPSPQWPSEEKKNISLAKSTPHISMDTNTEHSNISESQNDEDLSVVLGCRPDVSAIVSDMKNWCQSNGVKSVGVAVCGPSVLVSSVIKTCQDTSSSSLPFVVDEESFEW